MTMSMTLVGQEELRAKFDAMPKKLHDELYKTVTKISLDLENYIKNDKLLGQVLNQISGRLRSSIHSRVDDEGSTITGRVFSAAPMPYAAIHEYGGTIPAHTIEPVKAQALRFVMGAKVIFAKKVNIPAVNMPERSFMRSSLDDQRDEIVSSLKDAVARAVATK